MWDNLDNIIHIIESLNDFNSHGTHLFDIKYCSKEDKDCSLQSENCIRNIVKIKKPLGVGYVFKEHCFYINEHLWEF